MEGDNFVVKSISLVGKKTLMKSKVLVRWMEEVGSVILWMGASQVGYWAELTMVISNGFDSVSWGSLVKSVS